MLYYLLLASSPLSCDMVLQVSHKNAADILPQTLSSASANVFSNCLPSWSDGAGLLYYGTGSLIREPKIADSLFMSRTVLPFGPAIPVPWTLS